MDTPALRWQPPARSAAQAAVVQAQKVVSLKHYRLVARQLLVVLRRHGLGQSLAYLKNQGDGRPNSPYTLLAGQLGNWVLEAMGVSAKDALTHLAKTDSRFYREAEVHAWLFLKALRAALEQTP